MTMGWATVEMAGDAEERAVVTASMNAIGQAIAAGTQVVQFPATGAPRFRGGFISCLATTVGQLIMVGVILCLSNRDKRRRSKSAFIIPLRRLPANRRSSIQQLSATPRRIRA